MAIKFTPSPASKRLTRHSAPIVSSEPDIVQIGKFYAVKSESEEGLVLVQCNKVMGNNFDGLTLEKMSDVNENVSYKLLGMSSQSIRGNCIVWYGRVLNYID